VIQTDHASKEIQETREDESYVLEVTTTGAKLTAPTPLGAMQRAPDLFFNWWMFRSADLPLPRSRFKTSRVFPWRGLIIDSARHFIPLDVIREIDAWNREDERFHWHLSENQGFRVEEQEIPKLHEMGSDGLYYTKRDA